MITDKYLYYFGTSIKDKGHHLWDLIGEQMLSSNIQFSELPFNPEGLPHNPVSLGQTTFYNFAGFSILAIYGSCCDNRPGSKSIFFMKRDLTPDEFLNVILNTPIATKIIQAMPFDTPFTVKR